MPWAGRGGGLCSRQTRNEGFGRRVATLTGSMVPCLVGLSEGGKRELLQLEQLRGVQLWLGL